MSNIQHNNPLHIVFLDFDDLKNPLLSGGQARATYEVSKRLVQSGHRVTIVCSKFPGYADGYTDGIYYKHIGLRTEDIRKNNLAFFFALPFAVRALKADVIIECFMAPISTCFSPWFTKTPVIGMPTMFEADSFAKKYKIPFHWIEAFGCRQYKYFLAYSSVNKIKMEKFNPLIITRIIPNGVSEDFFTIPEQENGYAFFIGRIDFFQKGLDLLLDALKHMSKQLPIKIVIAGNGPPDEEIKLQKTIEEYGLSEKVTFVGRVEGERKEQLIANCLFGIYPSRFEDFPLVPLEFASLNKPIVCFDIPGLSWVSKDVSLKAKPFDINDLARAIYTITHDMDLRFRLKSKCRPFAKQYGWNSIAKKYEEFCYEVVEYEKKRN